MEREQLLMEIQKRFGYEVIDRTLLDQALTHSSWANEYAQCEDNGDEVVANYERLEFLGDAVVELAVSDLLVKRFPDLAEGELSKLRAGLVNTDQLAGLSAELGLGPAIRFGKGESATGGMNKPSILADVFESLVAVVYLEAGFAKAREVATTHFTRLLDTMSNLEIMGDFKTPLQEKVQARAKCTPCYRVVNEIGPDHQKTFEVEISIDGRVCARGTGRSKKEAEQDAARQVIQSGEFDG